MGATFRVEGSGSLVFGGTFRNVGGTADLTGGGQLAINGTLAGFEHGASPGPTTVRSTVVGGAVRMTVGTLRPTEGGPGAFRWGPDDLAVLDGTLRADQSIEAHCADNSYSYLRLAAGARNEGTIRLLPAARGTTCLTYFYPLAEFTNAGALVFGDGSVTGAAFQIGNAGRVLNEAAGSIEVDGTVANFVPITNDGTVTVRPGGRIDNYNRTFDHRNGVIANAGTFAMGSVGPLFRSQAGAVTGNPVTLLAGRLELVGAGAASFLVPASNGATLADGSGRALIRPQHHLIVEGLLATEVPAENRGEVTLTGDGSGNAIFGTSAAASPEASRSGHPKHTRVLLARRTESDTGSTWKRTPNSPTDTATSGTHNGPSRCARVQGARSQPQLPPPVGAIRVAIPRAYRTGVRRFCAGAAPLAEEGYRVPAHRRAVAGCSSPAGGIASEFRGALAADAERPAAPPCRQP